MGKWANVRKKGEEQYVIGPRFGRVLLAAQQMRMRLFHTNFLRTPTIWKRKLFHFGIDRTSDFSIIDRTERRSANKQGSVTQGLGADISFPPYLSKRPGI